MYIDSNVYIYELKFEEEKQTYIIDIYLPLALTKWLNLKILYSSLYLSDEIKYFLTVNKLSGLSTSYNIVTANTIYNNFKYW